MAHLEEEQKHVAEALQKLVECRVCEHSPGSQNNYCEPCERSGTPLPQMLSALY